MTTVAGANSAQVTATGGAWRRPLYVAVLVGLGCVAYANALRIPFLFDDKPHIVANTALRPPLSLRNLVLTERPVLTLTLAANYAWGRLDPWGYHVVNVALHIVCALVLYAVARRLLTHGRPQRRPPSDAAAFVAAAIFLLHPIQTESVTYVVQRAEILAALAVLGGLWFAARGVGGASRYPGPLPRGEGVASNQRPATRSRGLRRTGAALILIGTFGLLSKESAAVLPILVALYDWCFVARGCWAALARRWPLYVTLLIPLALVGAWRVGVALEYGRGPGGIEYGGATSSPAGEDEHGPASGTRLPASGPSNTEGESSGGHSGAPGASAPSSGASEAGPRPVITPWTYATWQLGVWVYYLRLIVWPDRLCFDCGYEGPWAVWSSALGDRVWPPALVLIGLAVVAWGARRRWPLVTFCLVAAAVALAPTSSLLPLSDAYVEHRLYLPIAFLAVLVTWLADAASRAAAPWAPAGIRHGLRIAAAGTVLAVLGVLTQARNTLYADPVRLYEDSSAKAPQNARVQFNLANAYGRLGRRDLAITHYQALIRLDPGPAPYHINLGLQYLAMQRNQEAVAAFEAARERAPGWAIVHRNLATAYMRVGRIDAAIATATRATELEPINTYGYKLLGLAYARAGRQADAIQAYRSALFFDPNDGEARQRLQALGATP